MTVKAAKPKLKSRPPAKGKEELDAFISGAGETEPKVNDRGSGELRSYPWEDPKVRDDVVKLFNLRLPEPYLLKLKFIAEHTPDSMQAFCQKVLLPAIDEKVNEIIQYGMK